MTRYGWFDFIRLCTLIVLTSSLSCTSEEPTPRAPTKTPDAAPSSVAGGDGNKVTTSEFEQEILRIGKEYTSYGRVDDEARWAPELCRMPNPSLARISKSKDSSTHGRKLYYVFAQNQFAYSELVQDVDQPPEQAIVKESWIPVELPPDAKLSDVVNNDTEHYERIAKREGKYYAPGEKGPLFVLYKPNEPREKTDRGWIYATLTPDGREITAIGLIESCMNCHVNAPNDRLFGLPYRPITPEAGIDLDGPSESSRQ